MKFSKTHEWVELDEEKGQARIGISKKALEELGEFSPFLHGSFFCKGKLNLRFIKGEISF